MEKISDSQANAIIDEALTLASEACKNYLIEIGGDNYPCGFAWVKIKPARGQFVKLMKQRNLGQTDDFEGGFRVYNPSKNHCQNMDAKFAGAQAFANHLKKFGVKAHAVERID